MSQALRVERAVTFFVPSGLRPQTDIPSVLVLHDPGVSRVCAAHSHMNRPWDQAPDEVDFGYPGPRSPDLPGCHFGTHYEILVWT